MEPTILGLLSQGFNQVPLVLFGSSQGSGNPKRRLSARKVLEASAWFREACARQGLSGPWDPTEVNLRGFEVKGWVTV